MLGSLNILAMSPELGTSNLQSNTFFIVNATDLKQVLSQNYNWLEFAAQSMRPRINILN